MNNEQSREKMQWNHKEFDTILGIYVNNSIMQLIKEGSFNPTPEALEELNNRGFKLFQAKQKGERAIYLGDWITKYKVPLDKQKMVEYVEQNFQQLKTELDKRK